MFGYLTQLNQIFLDNAEIEFKLLSGDQYHATTAEDRKAQLLIDIYLTFVEEVYYQHKSLGAYTDEHWVTWEKMLRTFGRNGFVRAYWDVMRTNFDPEFSQVVDRAFAAAQVKPVTVDNRRPRQAKTDD